MEFQQVVRRHRMVRLFGPDPVPQQSLDRLLHNATRGPSAGFSQGRAFLVLQGESLERFWTVASDAVDQSVTTAPLVIVPLSCKDAYLDRYARALYFGIMPQAVAPFRAAFGVPDDHEPIGAIAIGYDAETERRNHSSRRRHAAEVIHHGYW